ncbi:redox-regulated ATPase YchF [Chloroflexota bacterium]
MALNIGLVGLPNVGKSTTFNALTGAQNATVANYPFCTIQPNRAIVPLPDKRLSKLGELVNVKQVIHATVEFVDIAGLVKGASQGEGLGNQFLGQIRNTTALLHIVRCHDDPNVIHINEKPDPLNDIEIIEVELALADLEQLDRKIERLTSSVKGDNKLLPTLELAQQLREHLAAGHPASSFIGTNDEIFIGLNEELKFLTAKPVIYIANVDEAGLTEDNPYVQAVRLAAVKRGINIIVLCAQLEQDILEISPEEGQEFLELAGVETSGLEQVIRKSFEMLDLISFFTYNKSETRAWNIARGTSAPQAAGAIHTDFERGFIRAEVIPFETFEQYGSSAAVKTAGQMRLEGKEYIVADGDILYFRFNV